MIVCVQYWTNIRDVHGEIYHSGMSWGYGSEIGENKDHIAVAVWKIKTVKA